VWRVGEYGRVGVDQRPHKIGQLYSGYGSLFGSGGKSAPENFLKI